MLTAFLQAILDAPDDDTLRLVLADWLEETGAEPQPNERWEWLRLTGFWRVEARTPQGRWLLHWHPLFCGGCVTVGELPQRPACADCAAKQSRCFWPVWCGKLCHKRWLCWPCFSRRCHNGTIRTNKGARIC